MQAISSAVDATPSDWEQFNRRALERPPRELLRRALGLCELAGLGPGTAVDLGAGSGVDTLELLRRGWTVHAVDLDPASFALLAERVPAEARSRLVLHAAPFESFAFPTSQLVWAGYAFPFCPVAAWPKLLARIADCLTPGGRLIGDVFGDRHAFAAFEGVMVRTEAQVRDDLSGFVLEAFDVEDGVRPSGGQVTRWHAFGITARKPVTGA